MCPVQSYSLVFITNLRINLLFTDGKVVQAARLSSSQVYVVILNKTCQLEHLMYTAV